MPDNGDAISFATLAEKVDNLKAAVIEMRAESRIEGRELKDLIRTVNGNMDTLATQVQTNAVAIARLQERQTISAIVTSALALIASSIAAWLGIQK